MNSTISHSFIFLASNKKYYNSNNLRLIQSLVCESLLNSFSPSLHIFTILKSPDFIVILVSDI